MKKRILPFLLLLFILLGFGLPALATDTGFSDVAADAWYAGAVDYCREHGLMNGTSAATFSPDMTTTRAQLTAILWRQAGSPAAGAAPFSDVPATAYYAGAAAWAGERGIVSGYGDGRFAPDDPVTRAQLVTLLWRYSGSPAAAGQAPFADQSAIPSYASAAVAWARGNGIVGGIPQGTLSSAAGGIHLESGNLFDPEGSATRAQTAAILYRYLTMDDQGETPTEPDVPAAPDRNILVAYFSATGTTQTIAEYIAADLDADLHEIVPAAPYTTEDLNYRDPASRSQVEQGDASARPAISGAVEDLGQYDTVFLGYPIWNGQAPRIISTFLESCDLSGKTIVPFCTSGGSGIGSSAANLHPLSPSAAWRDGTRFAGGAAHSVVTAWVSALDLGAAREEETAVAKLNVQVGTSTFTATLEENAAVRAFVEMMEEGPVVLQMSDYSGFEKVGALGRSLPASNSQTTAQAGDIVLYNGNQIVLFYGSNSWSYTRLGRIDDLTGWTEALGRGDVQVTFRMHP